MARESQLVGSGQDLIDVEKSGIYRITNIVNNKKYIGSAAVTIRKRLNHHIAMLDVNKHKNEYLQHSWNKYGRDNFIFEIVEVVENKDLLLEREQFYLDTEKPEYNINKSATNLLGLTEEAKARKTATFTKTVNNALSYYYKIKNNEMTLEDVPNEYLKIVESRLNFVPSNKGVTGYKNSYPKNRKPREVTKEQLEIYREKLPKVYAFKSKTILKNNKLERTMICIGEFKNVYSLEEESKLEDFKLKEFMILRNLNGRQGLEPYLCSIVNVQKSCNKRIEYKGLQFSYQPSLSVMVNENVDENGGSLQ